MLYEIENDIIVDAKNTAKPHGVKERIPEKATFPSQPQIELLMGEGGEQAFHCLFSLTC
jgi:hypothetical protein